MTQGELTRKGEHTAFISLNGSPIAGSPLQFVVRPAAPIAARSYLVPPPHPSLNVPLEVLLQLVDKFGNDVERGEVRVDAKAFGPKASECTVVDCENGTFRLTFTAAVPGDYKVQVRLENAEMSPCHINVQKGDAGDAEGIVGTPTTPAAAPAAAAEKAAAAAAALSAAKASAKAAAAAAAPPAVAVPRRPSAESMGASNAKEEPAANARVPVGAESAAGLLLAAKVAKVTVTKPAADVPLEAAPVPASEPEAPAHPPGDPPGEAREPKAKKSPSKGSKGGKPKDKKASAAAAVAAGPGSEARSKTPEPPKPDLGPSEVASTAPAPKPSTGKPATGKPATGKSPSKAGSKANSKASSKGSKLPKEAPTETAPPVPEATPAEPEATPAEPEATPEPASTAKGDGKGSKKKKGSSSKKKAGKK